MSRRLVLSASTALALLTIVAPAHAADQVTDVSELVITATRLEAPRSTVPATIQVIDEAQLQTQTALGFSAVDVVSNLVPSFSPTRQKLSGFGETLRGRSPLYLVDGVPQSTPLRDDSRDGFTIDPFFIDKVEVVFGSNAIQGVGATGGVVNYVTVPTPKETEGFTGRALAQTSFDEDRFGDSLGWKAAAHVGRDFGRWDFVAGAAYESRGAFYDADGRRIGLDGAQGELQDSKSWSLFAKAGVDLTDQRRLEVMVNHFKLEGDNDYVTVNGNRVTGRPTTAARGEYPGNPTLNDVTSAAATYRDRGFFGGVLTATLYAHDYEGVFGGGSFADFQDPRIRPNLFDQSANNSEKQGFKIDYERGFDALPGFKMLAGLDGLSDKTFQALVLTNRLWVPETTYRSLAPFLQVRQGLMDGRLNLAAGVRQENATLEVDDYTTLYAYGPQQVSGGEPSFTETLYNVGATFEVVEGVTAYASYAQGFTMPDVGRVLRAIRTPNVDVDTYLDVTPVVSDNVELGLDYAAGPVQAGLAWFRSTSDRGSLLVLNPSGNFEVQRQRTEVEGVELSGRVQATEWLAVGGSYAHLDGRTDSNGDGSVDRDLNGANISPDRLMLFAEMIHGDWSGRLQAQHFYSRSFEGEPAANAFEGYTLADAVISWRAPFATVTMGVQNIFDEQYITYFSDTQNPTDNARFFAGRGRTVALGVTKDF